MRGKATKIYTVHPLVKLSVLFNGNNGNGIPHLVILWEAVMCSGNIMTFSPRQLEISGVEV